jgi:hypothetical protein
MVAIQVRCNMFYLGLENDCSASRHRELELIKAELGTVPESLSWY